MNFENITTNTKSSSLSFTLPTIIHILPDYNATTSDLIYTSGLRLNNCFGLVSTSKTVKLGTKTFNARKTYLDAKQKLTGSKDLHKTIKVFQNIPNKLDSMISERQFLIIDHTIISQATQHITELTNVKNGLFFLFQQLKREFLNIKTKYTNVTNNLFILLNSTRLENGLYTLLEQLAITPQLHLDDNFKTFDKFIIVSISKSDKEGFIFPIADYSTNGSIQINKSHIRLIDTIYKKLENSKQSNIPLSDKFSEFPSEEPTHINDIVQSTIISDIVKNTTIHHDVKIEKDEVVEKLDVNQKELSKILNKYNVRDHSVAENIKTSLDNYIENNRNIKTQQNLEKIILLAVHKTVFGTDEIQDEYLQNPAKLFAKLEEINVFSKDIKISDPKFPQLLKPSGLIDLKRVTGPVRHEFEFGTEHIHKNVKNSFLALQNRPDFPVQIKHIKHKYEDNDSDRYIEYTVTLQNTSGGFKDPYVITAKIPSLVNGRYFKLHGNNYILSNQQYFRPVTKTEPDKVRINTSYARVTLAIVNQKVNISEIDKVLEYINVHYNHLVQNLQMDKGKITSAVLKDKLSKIHKINLYENTAYETDTESLYKDDDGKWTIKIGDETESYRIGKMEYLYSKLVDIMRLDNPDESLRKSSKSIPYIQVHIAGFKMPLIVYLWQQIGLIDALKKLGIDFEISGSPPISSNVSVLTLENGKSLYIYPTNDRERFIINGLLIDLKKMNFSEKDLNNPEVLYGYINSKFSSRAIYNMNLVTSNIFDPVTNSLLEFQDMPTNLVDLLCHKGIDKLLNDPVETLSDLKLYRLRQAEIIFALLYKELMMAHNNYRLDVRFNEDAKVRLQEDYVIQCLLGVHRDTRGDAVLEEANPYNPVTELKTASKLIKTGPGGFVFLDPLHSNVYRIIL